MIFQPDEIIPVVYLISDPADVTTYYVQAIMRDTKTGSIIATQNLTGSGRRFSGSDFRAPFVNTGNMRLIDITISVYTDSGYTTKSDAYQEENFTYQISDRWSVGLAGVGGGGGIKYRDLVELFEINLGKFIKAFEDGMALYADKIGQDGGALGESVKEVKNALLKAFSEGMVQHASDIKNALPKSELDEIKGAVSTSEKNIMLKMVDKLDESAEIFRGIGGRIADSVDRLETKTGDSMTDTTTKVQKFVEEMRRIADDIKNVEFKVNPEFRMTIGDFKSPKEVRIPTIRDLVEEGKL